MSMPQDIRSFNRSVIEEFRANNGLIAHEMLRDVRLVLLTTTGARTGRSHTTPLAFFTDGPGRVVLWASAMAAASDPAWYRNLVAHPDVTVELRTVAGIVKRFSATAATARGAERQRLLGVLETSRPEIAAHQDRTGREIPLVVVDLQAR